MRATVLLAVAFGGVLGSLARYGVDETLPTGAGPRGAMAGFPWATFTVNIVGSFILTALIVLLLELAKPSLYLRPFLATGVLGGFTTFSTFAVETRGLLAEGHAGIGAAYIAASAFGCLLAGTAGIIVARRFVVRRTADGRS